MPAHGVSRSLSSVFLAAWLHGCFVALVGTELAATASLLCSFRCLCVNARQTNPSPAHLLVTNVLLGVQSRSKLTGWPTCRRCGTMLVLKAWPFLVRSNRQSRAVFCWMDAGAIVSKHRVDSKAARQAPNPPPFQAVCPFLQPPCVSRGAVLELLCNCSTFSAAMCILACHAGVAVPAVAVAGPS